MLCDAELFLSMDEEMANIIALSLKPDDPGWCFSEVRDKELVVRIVTNRIESLISACEDYFRTLKAALETLRSLEEA